MFINSSEKTSVFSSSDTSISFADPRLNLKQSLTSYKPADLFHGSYMVVREPRCDLNKDPCDFGNGFYCTVIKEQANSFAHKFNPPIVSCFTYEPNPTLKIKQFDDISKEWLDAIAEGRAGRDLGYDIVEGPMADDNIWDYVQDYFNDRLALKDFLDLAKFKYRTHQICFCTDRAIQTLQFRRYYYA